MKKVLSSLLVATVVLIYACGPSAEEQAKMEQAKQDSINAVAAADSMMKAQAQQQAMADSANMAADTTNK